MEVLNILRPTHPLTRDSFSRASPASARKSLIYLRRVSTARPSPSDNGHSVNVSVGASALLRPGRRLANPRGP